MSVDLHDEWDDELQELSRRAIDLIGDNLFDEVVRRAWVTTHHLRRRRLFSTLLRDMSEPDQTEAVTLVSPIATLRAELRRLLTPQ